MQTGPCTILRQYRRFAAAACLSLWFATAAIAETATHRDATGRAVTAGDTSRIVSIGGAVTEILYALGMDKKIVAVDTTSLYPRRAAAEKASVGYMRQLSAEGVLGLAPTQILAIEGAGPKETMTVLKAAKVPLVVVPDSYSGKGIIEKVRTIARATGVPERGECIAKAVQSDLEVLTKLRARIEKPARVLFVLSVVNGRAMVAGRQTAAEGIIRLAGAINAIDEYEGYKTLNDEAVVAAKPDAVLTMQRGPANTLAADEVLGLPAFALTPAAAHKAFVSMEGLYLLGFGPRSARAARDLASALYPDLKRETLPSEQSASAGANCNR